MKKSTSTSTTPTSVRSGAFVKKNRDAYNGSDWVVFTYGENGKPSKARVYENSGTLSRTEIRSAYNRETKMGKFDDTRARRVSNFV